MTPSDAQVVDVTFRGSEAESVQAWLVTPRPQGAIPDGSLAAAGVVSLLPQGRFPWSIDPTRSTADAGQVRAEVGRVRASLDLLAGRPDVEPARLGVVGHDFGAMYAILAAAEDPRV